MNDLEKVVWLSIFKKDKKIKYQRNNLDNLMEFLMKMMILEIINIMIYLKNNNNNNENEFNFNNFFINNQNNNNNDQIQDNLILFFVTKFQFR